MTAMHASSYLYSYFIPSSYQHNMMSRLVYHYHPHHCYTINTSTTDVSVYCSGHHHDCEIGPLESLYFCHKEPHNIHLVVY